MTLLMFSCAPYASTHTMISCMVSKLTLMILTMCIRSLGLEGNFCFNKSWAVKSITALAICREIVTHILICHWNFLILTWSGGTSRRRRKRIDQAVVPTFPTLRREYIVVDLEFQSVVDVEFVESVVDFHVSSWGKVTKQAWSDTCTKRAPPPRQVWAMPGRTLRQRMGSSESSPSFRNNHL